LYTSSIALAKGHVPYRALGLSEAASKDGFGNPLHYAINPQLSSHRTFYDNGETMPLKINDKDRKSVLDLRNNKDTLAVMVLSEGEAFRAPQSSFERENVEEGLSFVDAPYSSNKENPFRHIVRWSTRNNLLTYYGKSSPLSQTQNAPESNLNGRGASMVPHDRVVTPPRNGVDGGFHDAF